MVSVWKKDIYIYMRKQRFIREKTCQTGPSKHLNLNMYLNDF